MKRLIPLLLSLATALALSPASNAQYYPPAGNPNAVAPSGTPATGDTVYYNGSAWVRLAHAADGTVMVLASGIPSWTALSAGIPVPSSPATGSILWYNGTAWIASLNGLFGSGVTDNGTLQLGKNSNSVSGVLVVQSGGATGQGVITYPGTGSANIILPTANRTGLTANPGSTLPLLVSSTGVESTGALTGAQMLALTSQHVYVGNGSNQAADGGAGFVYNSSGASIVTIGVQSSSGGELVIAGNSGGFSSGNILLNGYTSGQTEITVPAVSGSAVITLATVNITEPTAQPTTAGGILNSDTSGNQSYTNDAQFAGTSGSTLTLGKASSATGILNFKGTTSGTTTLTVPAAAGGVTITLPTVTRTGLTANPGSTLPLLIDSSGNESTGTIPAAGFPILTGDVTTAGGALATTIANSAVTNAKSANMAAHTHKGNNTAGSAAPLDLTQAQLTAELSLATASLQGVVPALPTGAIPIGTAGNAAATADALFGGTSGSTLTLGLASSATGILAFNGTTSGTTNLTVPAAAGSVTITLPTVTTTMPTAQAAINGALLVCQTSGAYSFASAVSAGAGALSVGRAGTATGTIGMTGTTSGINSITTPAIAGTETSCLQAQAGVEDLMGLGGSGSDGAGAIGTGTVEGQAFNFTTLTTTSGQTSARPACTINASGQVTLVSTSVLTANGAGTAQTGQGIANAGGFGATAASSIGDPGYGPGAGEGGNNTGLIGPGGGAGSAANGGNGGGVTVASGDGEGGLNGAGNSHYSGNLNGSGGGGGGSGAGGTGGNGGGGATHLTIIAAGGYTGTGSITAPGSAGATGGTLGPGGGGGGAGTLFIYGGNSGVGGAVNLPACTISAIGGAGGAGTGTSANSGGGGGGYIGGTNAGTIASATFTVTGGAAGTGGSGTAGSAGGAGLANMVASKIPTLPTIVYDQLNGGQAGKDMCWILLARKAIRGEDYESEKSHIFIWDGEKGQASAPLSYVAATYAAPGKFSELCMALHFGGDASTASLCDSSNRDQCAKMFDTFKDSPIKGEMPVIDSTCDDTEFLRPSV